MTPDSDPTFDPFHDFSVPQDADLVSAPTPNAEDDDEGPADTDGAVADGAATDDDPVGTSAG